MLVLHTGSGDISGVELPWYMMLLRDVEYRVILIETAVSILCSAVEYGLHCNDSGIS